MNKHQLSVITMMRYLCIDLRRRQNESLLHCYALKSLRHMASWPLGHGPDTVPAVIVFMCTLSHDLRKRDLSSNTTTVQVCSGGDLCWLLNHLCLHSIHESR